MGSFMASSIGIGSSSLLKRDRASTLKGRSLSLRIGTDPVLLDTQGCWSVCASPSIPKRTGSISLDCIRLEAPPARGRLLAAKGKLLLSDNDWDLLRNRLCYLVACSGARLPPEQEGLGCVLGFRAFGRANLTPSVWPDHMLGQFLRVLPSLDGGAVRPGGRID